MKNGDPTGAAPTGASGPVVLDGIAVTHPAGLRSFEWGAGTRFVTTLNAELVLLARRDPAFRDFLRRNVVTVDGQWTFWALRRKYPRHADLAKQSGLTLLQQAWDACARDRRRLFILGAEESTNARAVESLRLSGWEGADGFSPPHAPYPFPEPAAAAIRSRVAAARPDVLVVAFGAPKQEFWARDHAAWLAETGVSYVLFLGGAVDMLAGKFAQAPALFRRLGLESAWRLAQSPQRWRRELRKLDFFRVILADRLQGGRT